MTLGGKEVHWGNDLLPPPKGGAEEGQALVAAGHPLGLVGDEEGGAGPGDPHHLPDGGLPVGEEVDATHVKDRVEALVPKGEGLGVRLAEVEGEPAPLLL